MELKQIYQAPLFETEHPCGAKISITQLEDKEDAPWGAVVVGPPNDRYKTYDHGLKGARHATAEDALASVCVFIADRLEPVGAIKERKGGLWKKMEDKRWELICSACKGEEVKDAKCVACGGPVLLEE